MGHYCCCGMRTSSPCQCSWDGWVNLHETPDDLPQEDGVYQVRVWEDCEARETVSKFTLVPRKWSRFIDFESQWEKDYWDGWVGYASVYAWKRKE